MNPTVLKERPAYVSFERRAVEDREASLRDGRYTTKDEDFVLITPPGTKDRIERNVQEWLKQLAEQVQQERLPAEFQRMYKNAYDTWKESGEAPLNGTYVKNCPIFSPSQIDNLLRANIKTVEDLANANEEMIARLGMGGRALKSQAETWLTSAKDVGAVASQLEALKIQNEELKVTNEALSAQVKELVGELTKFLPPTGKATVTPL